MPKNTLLQALSESHNCSAIVGAIFDAGHNLSFLCIVRAKLVADHHLRCSILASKQLAHQAAWQPLLYGRLNQNLKDKTFLVDGAPPPVLPAGIETSASARRHSSPNRPHE